MKLFVFIVIALTACASSTSINDPESVAPTFDATRDVILMLFTRSNPEVPVILRLNDLASIQNSPYDSSKPTRVLTHGFTGDSDVVFLALGRQVFLENHDFNIIVVDWSAGAQTINYAAAVARVRPVGAFVASFLDFLHINNLINFNNVYAIGNSLGAHVVGHIGKSVTRGRLNTIIGLDPAGPLFSIDRPDQRLDAGDATYVEAIHTNGPTRTVLGLGIGLPVAHADFFPNGGLTQPGCFLNQCHHDRAVYFYLEGISRNGFFGQRCNNVDDAINEACSGQPGAWISSEPSNGQQSLRGIFHLTTNSASPFAQGPIRP
ncbi:CLUMA_CG018908, isoform A [Clunio marinus]|uniref:CLUMA_CG018908, isoform A n=1 Tax=Clunio marinus TaxID=568069 RepID=A0A1J1J4B8_9DIPT|nr:CLUMA_CG018908, isoform A [Clunio marinus]